MTTYVFRDGVTYPKHLAPRTLVARSSLPMPMIISDKLEDVWNPADGRTYDSKSAYYQAVKDAGCEIAGNDPAVSHRRVEAEPEGVEEDIKRVIEQLS